ncbi:MAG: (2Fe-2S) ferredoxin domain-containing protein [Gammaproteobacteria bacterium]|nr:(2Fe-2S) ferredoxin domain-containing protein [Gammaproteobacteria bacterium]
MTTWDLTGTERLVLLCNGDTCTSRGADAVTVALRRALQAEGLDPQVHTARTRCLGRCDDGCTVIVQPDNVWYRGVTPETAAQIVTEHLAANRPVEPLVSFRPAEGGLMQVGGVTDGKRKPGRAR